MTQSSNRYVYQSKLNKEANYKQYKYCNENIDSLNWNDLIDRSYDYLDKNYETGGRCQIDIETGEVKVAIEIEGDSNCVDLSDTEQYGVIEFHTHVINGDICHVPSYVDLLRTLCTFCNDNINDVCWNVLIYKNNDSKPCLMLFRPKIHTTCSNDLWNVLISIDQTNMQMKNQLKSISKYFDIKYIGIPVENDYHISLCSQMKSIKKNIPKFGFDLFEEEVSKKCHYWDTNWIMIFVLIILDILLIGYLLWAMYNTANNLMKNVSFLDDSYQKI